MKIVVERHLNKLYTAKSEERPEFKASPESVSATSAIGAFLILHQKFLGFEIEYKLGNKEDGEKK
ncbi:MAG: hypothetical protein Q8O66_01175 [bacterium]|nr:hypothetical protein [bacterium]